MFYRVLRGPFRDAYSAERRKDILPRRYVLNQYRTGRLFLGKECRIFLIVGLFQGLEILIFHTKCYVFLQVFLLASVGFGGERNREGSEVCSSQTTPPLAQESPWRYEQQELLGWKLHIRRELIENQAEAAKLKLALEILQKQLEQIVRVVPGDCVAKLQRVPLWFSPVYPDEQPRAEYHPGAGWLKEHRRDPAMAKGVEFSNVGIFEAEYRRMPNFALHELAHAYHDQCLEAGFSNPEIQEAFERAKKSGSYERIEQRLGDGSARQTRAYGMSNPAEYFAESTEAFFSTNDFFPFTREQLKEHDPAMDRLLEKLWK